MSKKSAKLTLGTGVSIEIPLTIEGNREVARLLIDNVPYHFERLKKSDLVGQYHVDADPSFQPQSDSSGYCCILSPYSE
jgi:hypothetical protein